MITNFIDTIHSETKGRYFPARFCLSMAALGKERPLFSLAMAIASFFGTVYAGGVAVFCGEGVIRSFKEIAEDETPVVRLRPFGDIGGWSALNLLSLMALDQFFKQLMHEGEYLRIEALSRKWIKENEEKIRNNPKFIEKLYFVIHDYLKTYSGLCLFSKSLSYRRMVVLNLTKEMKAKKKGGLYFDRKLEEIFIRIKKREEKETSVKRYFSRFYQGEKALYQSGGGWRVAASLVIGVAVPIFLLISALCSYVGEIGLGTELFYHRESLTDVGHFGEWPFNALELIALAILLNLWSIIYEGDFANLRSNYEDETKNFKIYDKNVKKHLEIMWEEESSNNKCYFTKFQRDCKITVIKNEKKDKFYEEEV